MIVIFQKPTIKKSFCYSEGMAGETEQAARDAADAIRSDFEAFAKANMESYRMKCGMNDEIRYAVPLFKGKTASVCGDRMYGLLRESDKALAAELTDADKALVESEFDRQCLGFRKRLEAYWKRYGGSHIKSWTYICD